MDRQRGPGAAAGGRYADDPLLAARFVPATVPEVEIGPDLVLEERSTGFCGLVVDHDKQQVTLEDRHRRCRSFPYLPGGFLLDGIPVSLLPTRAARPRPAARTPSGSVAVVGARARVARAGRILVEGVHDAALVERVWGDDLRLEGVVVQPLSGIDHLADELIALAPRAGARIGVLVDHLIPGSKESRIAVQVAGPSVLVLGHPFVDIWQAVKPAALGIAGWPQVPRGVDWKHGVCAALHETGGPRQMWRRVLAAVDSYADLEVPLLRAVEELVDFVTTG